MDWNSFFSAISQASALLLGIVLAFLIFKILSEGTDFDSSEREAEKLLLESAEIKALADDMDFYWHDRMIIEYDRNIERITTGGELTGKSNEQVITLLKEKTRLYFPSDVMDFFNKKIEDVTPKPPASGELYRLAFLATSPSGGLPKIPPPDLWSSIDKFEDEVGRLELRANILVKRIVIQQRTIDQNVRDLTRLSKILLAFLPIIWLLIIYPLHFLPLKMGDAPSISFSVGNIITLLFSVKGFFLSCLTLSSLGVILYFRYICHSYISGYKMIRAKIKANDIDVRKYCKAFALREI